nr:hypothetical protein [Microctonus hyperodae filamentous virus]
MLVNGRLVWLLNVQQQPQHLGIEIYDVVSHETQMQETCYKYAVSCIVDGQYKEMFFSMLVKVFGDAIDCINDSNVKLKCYPYALLDLLLQVNNCERICEYDLVRIDVNSFILAQRIYGFLLQNPKPYVHVVNSIDLTLMLTMHLTMDDLCTLQQHQLSGKISKLSYYKIRQRRRQQQQQQQQQKISMIPNGLYMLDNGTKKMTLFSSDTRELYKFLPMISFDIETISNNLIDIPYGGNVHEKIISYALVGTYFNRLIIIVNYLQFFTTKSTFWLNVDEKLTRKYCEKYRKNYGNEYTDIYVKIESFTDEVSLLNNFIDVYSTGLICRLLTNNSKQRHFFVGHNIIRYDMPVMLRRFKWHQLHDKIKSYVTFDAGIGSDDGCGGDDDILIRFNHYAYIVDSYRIFKQHSLVHAGGLSLKSLTTTFLDDVKYAKQDLNPVSIRIYYMLADYFNLDTADLVDVELMKILTQATYINSVAAAEEDNEEKYNQVSIDLQRIKNMPKDLIYRLTNKNFDIKRQSVYPLDQFLNYNIMDCMSVIKLWEKFDYGLLFSLITQMYPNNLERALHSNVTKRSSYLFHSYALRYRQILASNDFSRNGTLISRPLLLTSASSSSSSIMTTTTGATAVEEFVEKFKNLLMDRAQPILSQVKYKTTKKKYAGAAVLMRPGYYCNPLQYDIASQYPNILIGKKFYYDSTDSLSARDLKDILTKNTDLAQIFDLLLSTNALEIYVAEDLNTNYTTYLYNFHVVDNVAAIVGQSIWSQKQLFEYIDDDTPLLLYIPKSDGFLNKYIHDLLIKRKKIQQTLKNADLTTVQRKILDAQQKFIKIQVNSIYGIYGNICISIAACTTLFGRKILICAAKLIPIIFLNFVVKIMIFRALVFHYLGRNSPHRYYHHLP